MTADPRILIPALRTLSSTFRDWAMIYDSTAEEARRVAVDMADAAENSRSYCEVLGAEALDAVSAGQRTAQEAAQVHSDALHAAQQMVACDERVQSVRARAIQAHDRWKQKLAAARAELQAAHAELSDAQAALGRAISNLRDAEHEHSSAVNAYNNCQSSYWTDNQGNRRSYDCSSHAARVNSAARALSEAQSQVNVAQGWVTRATHRVNVAEQEVSFCEGKFEIATDCLRNAEALRPRLDQGHRLADEGAAYARDGVERGRQARVAAGRAFDMASAALNSANSALDATGNGITAARALKSLADTQIEASSVGVHNLDATTDELAQFDDPRSIGG
jgi:Skp family chaperone for outer membrane proteins